MAFFFIPHTALVQGQEVVLSGDTAHRLLHVRRFKVGEQIEIQTTDALRFVASITRASARELALLIERSVQLPPDPHKNVDVFIAYISEQNIDLVIQKATELGARSVTIFESEYSPHGIKTDRLEHKMERWQAITQGACEQSGRATPLNIEYTVSLTDALKNLQIGSKLVMLEEGTPPFNEACSTQDTSLTLCIGPEGGWSEAEVALLKESGAIACSLGNYTLRAETAVIAGISVALNS